MLDGALHFCAQRMRNFMEHAHFTMKPRPFGVPSLKGFLVAENGKSIKAMHVHILDNFICMIPHPRTPRHEHELTPLFIAQLPVTGIPYKEVNQSRLACLSVE